MSFVSTLEPSSLWTHFDRILEIPRGSKREDRARAYVIEVAERAGFEHRTDGTGNVVVRKPASEGRQGSPVTILQAHLDMVQEKNSGTDFDFSRDAIRPVRDGDYLRADGTTLGADNGIGVAAMLAVLEADSLSHGPLELLFTIDEETGLTGASGLAADLLEGRRLLNLDSEEEGVLTIGCAGGADTYIDIPLARAPVEGSDGIAIRVHGLKGGHSGVDIHLQRANAIKVLVRALAAASEAGAFRISSMAGGNAHNAIPREATATIVAAHGSAESVAGALEEELRATAAEFGAADPGLAWSIDRVEAPSDAWTEPAARRALSLLVALPHGVLRMSDDIEGLVESSTNLAVVAEEDARLRILMSSRSSVMTALAAIRRRLRAFAAIAGAEANEKDGYPGWKPDVSSELLAVMREVYAGVTGKEPEVGAVHAGLECGIIGEKYPGMDMISFGPQIEFPHSPDERVRIPTVEPFWEVLVAALDRLAA